MSSIKTTVLVTGGLVVLVASGAMLAGASAQGPPEDPGAQNESDLGNENETIETVTGTLENPSGEDYQLDGLAIDIGPSQYVDDTQASVDFDGDGSKPKRVFVYPQSK